MARFVGAVLFCEICGSEFKVPRCRAKTARFCGHECSVVGRAAALSKPKVAVVCKHCGVTFYEHRSHAGKRVYCSKVCMESHASHVQDKSDRHKGSKNHRWAGGICRHSDGYLYERCDEHPFASNGYVLQHRLVAERHLREISPKSKCLVRLGVQLYLKPGYVVHHKDGDKKNNDIGNLEVMAVGEHISLHNAIRRNTKLKE